MPGDGPEPEPDREPVERAETLVRRIAAGATAGMLLLSWPLWVGTEDFPRVPFLPALPETTGAVAWGAFLALVAAVAISAARRAWRLGFGLSCGLLALAIGQDQHRFQPWVYQYVMTSLFLAALPGGEGLRYARWWFVALYLHSGLSKLDISFCNELGPVFLRALMAPLGVEPSQWPVRWQRAAVLAMPTGEIALAWALARPETRWFGRIGAVVLHSGLIAILGPAGLGHSTIVLVWNAAMLAEVWVAFGPDLAPARGGFRRRWRSWPVAMVFWAGALLPLGERWGTWDSWPSHALYASHVERLSVLLPEGSVESYPAALRENLRDPGDGPWLRLDLTGWSRAVRGTPVYPQNRACLGLAEALAARYGGPLPVRVVAFGSADRWTGHRRREEADGLDRIRGMGARYRCNAHPWIKGNPRREMQ